MLYLSGMYENYYGNIEKLCPKSLHGIFVDLVRE